MTKTTVYLPDDLKRELAGLARRTGRSEAELIRMALSQMVIREQPPKPRLPLFRGGDPTLAEHVDEALADFGA
jgi:plasmid stability protein